MRVLVICIEGYYSEHEFNQLHQGILICLDPAFREGDIDDVLILNKQLNSKYYIIDTKEGLKQGPDQRDDWSDCKYTPPPFMSPTIMT